MKRSNKKTVAVHKTSLSSKEGLEVLADIHRAMEALNEQMSACVEQEDMTTFERAKAEFERLSAQFNYFIKQLPPVKFDDKQGVYYVAKDEATGLEVFRVKVSRTYEGWVDIPAESEDAARLAAMILYGQRGVEMKKVGKQPTVEIVGVPVEREGE